MSLQAALEERRKVFVGLGILVLILLGVGQALSGAVGGRSEPNLLTALALGLLAMDIPLLSYVLFTPASAARLQASSSGEAPAAAAAARALSRLGAALAFVPVPVGFAMLIISGDVWRLYAFAVLSGVSGAIFWGRIGTLLRTLPGPAESSAPEPGG